MNAARITIALPTVSRLELFKLALESTLSQTVPVEIIVSDNGSNDGTKEYLANRSLPEYARAFQRDVTIPPQEHLQFLVDQTRTEWVVFLSDDDYLEREFCEAALELIDERPGLSFLYTGCNMMYADTGHPCEVGPRFENGADFLYGFMKGLRNICLCATVFRVSDMRRIGPLPDTCMIGDMYYWTRLAGALARDPAANLIGCDPRILSNYYLYRPSLATQTNINSVDRWAAESAGYTRDMCIAIQASPAYLKRQHEVLRLGANFLARTTSNQFIWTVLRGTRKLELMQSSWRLRAILFTNLHAVARVIVVILLPRSWLQFLILRRASAMAKSGRRS